VLLHVSQDCASTAMCQVATYSDEMLINELPQRSKEICVEELAVLILTKHLYEISRDDINGRSHVLLDEV
jgi:hypothetical protein